MTIFEISIKNFVDARDIFVAFGNFFSIPSTLIFDRDSFFSVAANSPEKSLGLGVMHAGSGYRSLIDVVTNFDCDDGEQFSLCNFLSRTFCSQVAIGDFISDVVESTGRYIVVNPTGEFHRAVEISNGDIFELRILPDSGNCSSEK